MNQEPIDPSGIFALDSERSDIQRIKGIESASKSQDLTPRSRGQDTSRSVIVHVDHNLSQEISEKNSILGWKITVAICGVLMVMYLVSWVLFWGYHQKLSDWSVGIVKSLKKPTGAYKTYLLIFHSPYWTNGKYVIAGILLTLSPSKVSALKSLWIFFLSNWIRAHLQIVLKERRPYFLNYIKAANFRKCSCSYGHPSEVAEEGVLFYLILTHEFFIHRTLTQRWKRITMASLAALIMGNVLYTQFVFGQHDIQQLANGTLQASFFYGMMLLLTNPLTNIFRHFLEKKSYARNFILGSTICMYLVSVFFWFTIYKWQVMDDRVEHVRCGNCFYNRNKILMRRMTKLLVVSTIMIGIILGVMLLRPIYMGKNESMLKHHISWKGLARILIAVVVHFPLLSLKAIDKLDGDLQIFVRTGIFILCGFLISYLPMRLFAWLNLSFRGDLYPKGFNLFSDKNTHIECSPLLTPDLPLHRRRMDAESHKIKIQNTVFKSIPERARNTNTVGGTELVLH